MRWKTNLFALFVNWTYSATNSFWRLNNLTIWESVLGAKYLKDQPKAGAELGCSRTQGHRNTTGRMILRRLVTEEPALKKKIDLGNGRILYVLRVTKCRFKFQIAPFYWVASANYPSVILDLGYLVLSPIGNLLGQHVAYKLGCPPLTLTIYYQEVTRYPAPALTQGKVWSLEAPTVRVSEPRSAFLAIKPCVLASHLTSSVKCG